MVKLCVIEGDGIGHEVVPAALEVLQAVLPDLQVYPAQAGWETFEDCGNSVPEATLETIRDCKAVLFGAVSSPTHRVEGYQSAILTLRQELGLYANLRPVQAWPLTTCFPGLDMMLVRENTEGLYSRLETANNGRAVAQRVITREASLRIAEAAYDMAQRSGKDRVTVVHKANVLPLTDGLFRDSVKEVAQRYPDIQMEEMLVDTAAYWLVRDPTHFKVLVTTNLFGDILSDAAAAWAGGLGMAPSLNLGPGLALAEPIHGTAPDIAGQGLSNPIGTLLSASLLVRYHWNKPEQADRLEAAVRRTLKAGLRTPDLAGPDEEPVNTRGMTEALLDNL